MTQKKKNVFSRKATDHLSPLGLLKKGSYSVVDCFPDDQKFAVHVEEIKGQVEELVKDETPLVELLAQLDRSSPLERVFALYLIFMSDIVNPKGMKLICLVLCTAMTMDTNAYTTANSDVSEDDISETMEVYTVSDRTTKTKLDYFADMTNDIYEQVIDCQKTTKLAAVYTIKLFCTFLFKLDLSSQTVNLNRHSGTSN